MAKISSLGRFLKTGSAAAVFGLIPLVAAHAEDAATAKWEDTLKFSAQIEAGGTYNSSDPNDGRNFGRLFDDKSNGVLLNQLLLTATRPVDASRKGYDVGFKLQFMVGADARYTHFLKEFQNTFTGENQLDLVEGWVQFHTPWLTEGGFDVKLGQYVTLSGAETIDPSTNYLYSHSYLFNFGIPLKHTGVMTVTHVTPSFDLYLGIDSGVNTSLFKGDNNGRPAFHGGFGFNMNGGALTILATTHIGPEISRNAAPNGLLPPTVNANKAMRYLNDITAVWKVSDKLTSITDFNFIYDEAVNAGNSASGYGITQYLVYALNDNFSLVGRAEVWRDENGSFVAQFADNQDFMRALDGQPVVSPRTVGGGATTYGGFTFGLNIKPALGIPAALLIRPEVRYDTSLNGTRPFNDSSDRHMFTAGMDVVFSF